MEKCFVGEYKGEDWNYCCGELPIMCGGKTYILTNPFVDGCTGFDDDWMPNEPREYIVPEECIPHELACRAGGVRNVQRAISAKYPKFGCCGGCS